MAEMADNSEKNGNSSRNESSRSLDWDRSAVVGNSGRETHSRVSSVSVGEHSFRWQDTLSRHPSARVHDEPDGNAMNDLQHSGVMAASLEAGLAQVDGESKLPDKRMHRTALLGKGPLHWILMATCCAAVVLGVSSAVVLGRFYFVHGGSQRWLYTLVQTGGWPSLLPLLLLCYKKYAVKPCTLTPRLAFFFLILGCITGLSSLCYSWGLSFLPVSTSSLLNSSQLAFNAIFAYALVGHKITSFILNSIVLTTLGAVLLALDSSSDRPEGTTQKQYIIGFFVTILASALYGLSLPLIELLYRKVVGQASFARVLEVQLGIQIAASIFSLIGMGAAGEFRAIKQEAKDFDLSLAVYTNTLLWSAVGWQVCNIGSAGMIFLASALFSCSFITAMIPVLPILGVIFFHDAFSSIKGMAMVLAIWGFISYIYGGYLDSKESKEASCPIHTQQPIDSTQDRGPSYN